MSTRVWASACVAAAAAALAARAGEAAEADLERIEAIVPRHYVCQRTERPPTIDGRLNEACWRQAQWTEDFVDIEGADRRVPRFRTRAKMLWDEHFFYVAAELEEPHVWATLTERDAVIFQDNDFEVFIDPDGDTHQYYEFEMNAYGTEWDLFLVKPYRNGGPAVNAWNIDGLKTAVHVAGTIDTPADTDTGWSVELAFPWRVLRECAGGMAAPPAEGDQWRVNFSRVEWQIEITPEGYEKVPGRPEDNWVWSPQGLINMHYPEQWGLVQFTETPVGQAPPPFAPSPADEARTCLRAVYYREHRFREAHGHFTASLDSLDLPAPALRHHQWPPAIEVTSRSFVATLPEAADLDGDGDAGCWVIRDDSRVWKE